MSDTRHPGLNLGIRHPAAHEEAEEVVFGFWVFLMSDLVLFACLFATYATMLDSTAGAPGGHVLYDIRIAAAETAALLLSSFTFGLASIAMKHGEHDPAVATAAKRCHRPGARAFPLLPAHRPVEIEAGRSAAHPVLVDDRADHGERDAVDHPERENADDVGKARGLPLDPAKGSHP